MPAEEVEVVLHGRRVDGPVDEKLTVHVLVIAPAGSSSSSKPLVTNPSSGREFQPAPILYEALMHAYISNEAPTMYVTPAMTHEAPAMTQEAPAMIHGAPAK